MKLLDWALFFSLVLKLVGSIFLGHTDGIGGWSVSIIVFLLYFERK